jgi:general secretion pathway protein G
MVRRAFTLIELLIVIAVIGILVGIALPRFKGMQDEGNIARAKGELRMLQAAVESYYSHNNNTYPATLSALLTAVPNIAGTTALPKDPFTSSSDYGYSTAGSYYVVYSVGPSANGSASVSATGTITETNGASCIYATNGSPRDTQP